MAKLNIPYQPNQKPSFVNEFHALTGCWHGEATTDAVLSSICVDSPHRRPDLPDKCHALITQLGDGGLAEYECVATKQTQSRYACGEQHPPSPKSPRLARCLEALSAG
jgi:hypothetical protein